MLGGAHLSALVPVAVRSLCTGKGLDTRRSLVLRANTHGCSGMTVVVPLQADPAEALSYGRNA